MLGLTDLPVAIEANGRVSSLCAAKAFHDVGAKRAVLSTCASEALEARTLVPALSSIHCAFPFAPKAPGLDALAGPVNCLEVVASARPLLPEFDLETNPALARSRRFSRLASLESLDLLCVSAASSAAADGLRWFLEKVYRPFLAQRRISLIVAGEITSLGPFPIFDDVVFVGPVEYREPLYAAAKIVIAPMLGSDGGSLELLEALSKAMPIVATTASIEKVGGVAVGLEAHDGERAFAEAISHLLDSPERRASAAAASFAAARRLGAGSASILAMNALFRSILGDRAIAAPADEPCVLPNAPVEWTPAIGAANSFLRSYVAAAPLEGLGELARQPDQGLRLATQIADCLLERRSAPLLQVDGHLSAKLTRLADVSLAVDATSIAKIASASAVLPAPQSGRTPHLVVNRQFSGAVVGRVRRGRCESARPTAGGLQFFRALPELGGETIAWEFAGDGRDAPGFCLLDLKDVAEEDDWIVYHHIPVSRGLRALGRRVFANWRFAPTNNDGVVEERLFLSRLPIAIQTKKTWATGISAIFSSGRRSPLYKWSPWARANPLFDADWYVGEYPDVVEKKIVPFKHYNHSGVREGRNPNPLFDTNWYLERYPEVRNSGENPLDHYLEAGAFEGYDPGPFFSTSRYLDDNPDVRAARLNPLLHYLEYGRREGREIHPSEPIRAFQSILSPAVVGARGTPWIEIELLTEAGWELAPLIEVSCGERKLEFRVYDDGDHARLRAVLPRAEAATGAVRLRAALRTGPVDRIEISAIRVGWSSGGPEIALEQIERYRRCLFVANHDMPRNDADRDGERARLRVGEA